MNQDLFPKLIYLDEYTKHSEPTIRIVRPRDRNVPHVKLAEDALGYIQNVKPIPGKTIILVLAMTAGEWYSANRNGDAWPERPLRVGNTVITADEVLPKHYKTFESNARVYRHHINKDPAGKIGDVLRAFYNWPMHRVELLLVLDNQKASDVVQEIESGKYPAVSMGCKIKYDVCFPATTLVETQCGLLPIEQVEPGTQVRTHVGRWLPAKPIPPRNFSGTLVRIKAKGHPNEISATDEHPFLAIPAGELYQCTYRRGARCTPKPGAGICQVCGKPIAQPHWIPAKDLSIGDYLVSPRPITVDQQQVDPSFAYVVGRYTGDGHLTWGTPRKDGSRDLAGVHVASHEDPERVSAYTQALEKVYPVNPVHTYAIRDEKAVNIYTTNRELAGKLSTLIGCGSETKRIDPSLYDWDETAKLAFVAGLIDSDGYVDPQKGCATISSCNQSLLVGVQNLLTSIAIPSTLCKKRRQDDRWSSRLYQYQLGFSGFHLMRFVEFSVKAQRNNNGTVRTVTQSFVTDRYLCGAITSIERKEVSALPVYNLQVEEDESYIAEGVAVHNCSICGNKAPSRAQYCDDAKFQLGQYLPNGKQVFVWNPSPTFFDLSMVRRPADRIGFMMKKVAQVPEIWSSAELGEHMALLSGKLANARKLSDINKIINGDVVAAKEDDGDLNMTRQFAHSIATPAAATMPALDDSVIREMLRSNPARVLATLASMGIFLTTPEFIKFFVWKMAPGFVIPEGCLEGAVEVQQAVFDVLSKNPDLVEEIQQTGFLNLGPGNIDPTLQQRFSTLLEKRSCLRSFVQRRLVDSVLYKTAHMPSPHGYIVVDQKVGQGYATRMAPKLATQNRRWVKDAHMQDVIGSGALLSGAYKFFTPGFDTKTAALRLTHERLFVTTPRYQHITLEPKLASASFGEVASWLGKVICL
jgi:hypothetical protein